MDTSGACVASIVIVRAMAGCANSPKTISKTTSSWRIDTERMGVSVGEAGKSSKKYSGGLRQRESRPIIEDRSRSPDTQEVNRFS
jgi:hypothetical protein